MIFELQPKLKLFSRGTCFKVKQDIICQHKAGVTEKDTIFGFDKEWKTIPKNSILIYLEDKQFYSSSKEFNLPIGIWIRAKVIAPDGDIVWITLYYEQKASWEFKTYLGKKESVIKDIKTSYEIISLALNTPENTLITK